MRTDGDDFSVALCASRGFRAVRFRRTIIIIFIVTFGCSPRRVEQKRQQQRVRGDDETDGSRERKGWGREHVAESLFKESGGACGPGYEMRVKLVTGAECECVEPELCTREGEMTAEERSYGKKPKPSENSNGEGGGESKKEMMSSDGGIQFTFNN